MYYDDDPDLVILTDLCFLCEKPVLEERLEPGKEAIETIKCCSRERGDGKHLLIEDKQVVVHRRCRNIYTKPSAILAEKRKSAEKPETSAETLISPKKLRSGGSFQFQNTCFFCCEDIRKAQRKDVNSVRRVRSNDLKQKIKCKALLRRDRWGRNVLGRMSSEDLVAASAVYHQPCWVRFSRGSTEEKSPKHPPAAVPNQDVSDAMNVIYQYMEDSDDCQFSVKELHDLVAENKKKYICETTIKRRLLEQYQDNILIASTKKKASVVCFRAHGEKVLNNNWHKQKLENEEDEEIRIMKKAGEIVRKHIENTVYDNSSYPSSSKFLKDVNNLVPTPLKIFLETVALKQNKNKQKNKEHVQNKCTVIGHCIISLVKPRSFISPIMLGIGAHIHQNFGSKGLINTLANMGLCSTYHDVKVLEASIVMAPGPNIKLGTFAQFAFDNCDFNINTIDGHGTFHNMSGIECITPVESILNVDERCPKLKRLTNYTLKEKKGVVQVMSCPISSNCSGLEQFKFSNLDKLFPPIQYEDVPSPLEVVWMLAKLWNNMDIPGWQGFLEKTTSSCISDTTGVRTLPFIMAPPSDRDTVYTALMMAYNKGREIGLHTIFVTFDLPLYMKALEITLSSTPSSPLQNIVVRLGGFHLIMSFLGAIGSIMAGSGLQELISVVYSENSTKHILSGHAYARAIRAHFLIATALCNMILTNVGIDEEEKAAVEKVLYCFSNLTHSKENITSNGNIISITLKLKEEMKIIQDKGPTSKLWIQYLTMVTLLRRFLEAERTGIWAMHLNTVNLMIPYFIASGHIHYAKASHIYVQQMHSLPNKMTKVEFDRYASGYFTIKRSNKFCSGTSPDMVIEQTANREFKMMGGIVQRGFTDDVLSSYVLTKPALSLITEAIEDFSGIAFFTSEQHVDARESRIKRDSCDIMKLQQWLELNNPFNVTMTVPISLGTGITGTNLINCHMAKEVGRHIMTQIVGKTFDEIKLKRSDNVRSLAAVTSSVKVNDKVINIDPMILYHRMLIWRKSTDDLSNFFKYEISPYPLSLFTYSGMRKNVKSALYDEFASVDEHELNRTEAFIVDGGYLLHAVKWNKDTCKTYHDICMQYVNYVIYNFKPSKTPVTVVFDGYDDPDSTKKCEQLRRYRHIAPQFQISAITPVYGNQERFLGNAQNKKQLIAMLSSVLRKNNVVVKQSSGDADLLIVQTAVEKSQQLLPTIVTQDIDVLVILTALATPGKPVLFLKPKIGRAKRKVYSSTILQGQHSGIKTYILLAHAFSGCDTTSAIHGKGKKQLMKIISNNSTLKECVDTFNSPNTTASNVKKSGETMFLHLYGAKAESLTLDALRFTQFQKSLNRNTPKLESLPPTSDSAAQHSYRVYHQIQQWLGNKLEPEKWGWVRQEGDLHPVRTTLPPAPDEIIQLISCSCKGDCSSAKCSCKKNGITCSALCKTCEGVTCCNSSFEKEVNFNLENDDLDEDADDSDFEDI